MSVGSAFDAYAKSYLHEKLFGKNHSNSNQFDLDAILVAQVEPHNLDFARVAGKDCFDQYCSSGAMLDLLLELQQASSDPRFEFEVCGPVSGVMTEGNGYPPLTLLGKPDLYYVSKAGVKVVVDWKVNGYCSKYVKSPSKGYVRLRSAGKTSHGYHKNASLYEYHGMTINIAGYFEHTDVDWSRQLATYAWLLGEDVGGDFIVGVDQLCCSPANPGVKIRVAEHRMRVSSEFQNATFNQYVDLWDIVHSGYIFRGMTRLESDGRCALLEEQAEHLYGSQADPMFTEFTRR